MNVQFRITSRNGSGIIFVFYQNPDPELATLVLNELVNRYFEKHLEVHRSAGAFDFVTQQADQVRARLNQTDDALKALKAKAGIASSADSAASLNAEVIKIEDAFHSEETDLAEQRARVKQLEHRLLEVVPPQNQPRPPPPLHPLSPTNPLAVTFSNIRL